MRGNEKFYANKILIKICESHILNGNEKERVIHGMSIIPEPEFANKELSDIVFLVYSGKMIGVGVKDHNLIRVKKVFEVL